MPLEIQPLTRDDGPEAAILVAESYKGNPFQKVIFPDGHNSSSMRRLAEERVKAVDDPDMKALKVVNTENGEIAAVAVWVHTQPKTDEEWDHEMEHCMDKYPEARQDILREFAPKEPEAKKKIMGRSRWWELQNLSTSPKYQRQGIGSMLMKWGNARSDKEGIPGFIVATDEGYGLYVKHGYREVGRWEVDLERWPELRLKCKYKNVYLVRYPGGTAA